MTKAATSPARSRVSWQACMPRKGGRRMHVDSAFQLQCQAAPEATRELAGQARRPTENGGTIRIGDVRWHAVSRSTGRSLLPGSNPSGLLCCMLTHAAPGKGTCLLVELHVCIHGVPKAGYAPHGLCVTYYHYCCCCCYYYYYYYYFCMCAPTTHQRHYWARR
mmetsp:Transcript_39009/g.116058  ORF Transcript_39009/g.116058 Transcript_39009/m.116058 type:complete len:163 (+) Transcript_39009:609-1097(+)